MDSTVDSSNGDVKDALAKLLLNLPEPVREFITGPERDEVSDTLSRKYQLHADQAGDFDRAYIQMLLGIISPEEFTATLRGSGIPEVSVAGLTNDVNEMVFKRLRQRERDLSERTPEAPKPVVAAPAQIKEEVAPPPPRPTTPEPAPTPIPQPTYAPPPGAHQQTYWVPVSITAVPQPYMTTEPPPNSYPQPSIAQPAPPAPPPPLPQPAPVQEERPAPPPPLPQPTWRPEPPPNLPTHEGPHTPLTKEYAADPYREPPI